MVWPGINADVKKLIENSETCATLQRAQSRETLHPHEVPAYPWEAVGVDISNQARGCGLDRANPDRGAQRRGLDAGPAQIRGLGLLFPHAPATCTLLTDLNVARIIWCTPRNKENRFERFSQLLHFVWLSDGKLFFFTSAKWSSSSKAAVYGGAGSLPAVDLFRFEGLVA